MAVPPVCAACGRPLTGRFCAHCGEETLDSETLTVRHFLTHVLQEVLDLDGKVWRTLRGLLLRPGFLTTEYFAGRRRVYVGPVRLLLIAILAYAVLTRGGLTFALFLGPVNLSIAPAAFSRGSSVADTLQRADRFHVLGSLLAATERTADLSSDAAREKFHATLEKIAEPLSFANVLLLALVLFVVFRRTRPLLVSHGVFSMHLVSFVLLTSLLMLPSFWLDEHSSVAVIPFVGLGVSAWQFTYIAVAIRRFYFAGDVRAMRSGILSAAASFLFYLSNSVFTTGVQTLGAALALWRL